MKLIKVCEYSRSMSFHDDLILQDQASGERSQDQWSSGCVILPPEAEPPRVLGLLNLRFYQEDPESALSTASETFQDSQYLSY